MFTADRFFAKIWSVWMLAVIVAVLMIGVAPKFFAIPALGVMIAMTLWCINCAYRSERFVSFANLRMFFNLSSSPLFASLRTLAVTYATRQGFVRVGGNLC
jgi:hypothetical protein